jgi:hypothetical protein
MPIGQEGRQDPFRLVETLTVPGVTAAVAAHGVVDRRAVGQQRPAPQPPHPNQSSRAHGRGFGHVKIICSPRYVVDRARNGDRATSRLDGSFSARRAGRRSSAKALFQQKCRAVSDKGTGSAALGTRASSTFATLTCSRSPPPSHTTSLEIDGVLCRRWAWAAWLWHSSPVRPAQAQPAFTRRSPGATVSRTGPVRLMRSQFNDFGAGACSARVSAWCRCS